jgi:hypothetical protein
LIKYIIMKKIALTYIIIAISIAAFSQNKLITYFERLNYLETPRYDSTIAYCKRLSNASSIIHYTTYGISPEGRALPLLIADKDKFSEPDDIKKSGRTVLLIQACIHAGEPDGKDAGLLLLRDIITKKEYQKLLDSVTIVFIPIFNVDGHERFSSYNRINQNGPKEMGWRTNSTNLNLNRDYIKAEAPEIKAWLKLFNEWNPDFFIDCHVTDGADYIYPLTYALEINGNMDSSLTNWQKNTFLPFVKNSMEQAGYPIFPYISFREWHDINSGLESWVTPPMLSQGYTAIANCPGLLIETHMLKDYKTRVLATFKMLQYTLEILNKEGNKLHKLINESNTFSASKIFREKPFPLDFEYNHDSVMVNFKGMEYTEEKSDISGGTWFKFGKKVKDYSLPYFNHIKPTAYAHLPEFYIVPKQWTFVTDLLNEHKIFYYSLNKDTTISVSGYSFNNVEFNPTPYEGRQRIKSIHADTISYNIKLYRGSVIVPMNQAKAKVIAHMLEPLSPASLLQFGFFNTIFEQKEYGESYVLETLAREMLKDPKIKEGFEREVKNNPNYPKESYAVLNWFYTHSAYKDLQQNIYPIAKSFDEELMRKLPLTYHK